MKEHPANGYLYTPGSMDWKQARKALTDDYVMREVHVYDTDEDDWEALLDMLDASTYGVEYLRSPDPAPGQPFQVVSRPKRMSDVIGAENAMFFVVDPEGMNIHSHPAVLDEIEFTVYPHHLNDQEHMESFLQLLQAISNALGRTVVVCNEGQEDEVYLRFEPGPRSVSPTV